MLWMRLWCGNGDNVWQWHMAHVHCTLQSESDPLCCNYDFSSFTFLFCVSFPSAAMANPSHIAHRTNTFQKMDCFQCCEPFGIARTANLLLLVCDAPITSNTPDINCTHTHIWPKYEMEFYTWFSRLLNQLKGNWGVSLWPMEDIYMSVYYNWRSYSNRAHPTNAFDGSAAAAVVRRLTHSRFNKYSNDIWCGTRSRQCHV